MALQVRHLWCECIVTKRTKLVSRGFLWKLAQCLAVLNVKFYNEIRTQCLPLFCFHINFIESDWVDVLLHKMNDIRLLTTVSHTCKVTAVHQVVLVHSPCEDAPVWYRCPISSYIQAVSPCSLLHRQRLIIFHNCVIFGSITRLVVKVPVLPTVVIFWA